LRAWAPAAIPVKVQEPIVSAAPPLPWWKPDPVLLLVLAPLLFGIWRPGEPAADDLWGHLARAEYLADRVRQDGLRAYFTSAWMPEWFLGDPYRTYQPPLTALLLGPLAWVCGGGLLAARLLLTLVVVAIAHLSYLAFAGRDEGGRPAALLVAALVAWSPDTVRAVFAQGDVPRVLALLALPIIAVLTEAVLVTRGFDWTRGAGLALAWCWAILAQPQQAYVFAIGMAIYAVARMVSSHLRPERVPWVLVGPLLGAALAAPWLVPAWGGEMPDVPYVPDRQSLARHAADAWALVPLVRRPPGLASLGLGALVLAVVAAALRPDPRRGAWLFSGLLAFWLALGPGVLTFLPFGNDVAPERFLTFAAFAIAAAAGGLLPLSWSSRAGVAAVVGAVLVLVDAWASAGIARQRIDSITARSLARQIASRDRGGRLALFVYPEPTSAEVYALTRLSDHELVQGWGLDGSPQHPPLRRLPAAPTWGSAWLQRMLDVWDVRKAVVAGRGRHEPAADQARTALLAAGFVRAGVQGRYEVLEREAAPARLQALPERQMVLVGRGLQPFLGAFPFAAEATRPTVRQNRPILARHPALGVFRFESEADHLREAEQDLRRYVESGGRLVVDLSGMDALAPDGFLGVRVRAVEIGDMPMRWTGPLAGLPERLAVPERPEVPSRTWRGATYEGLDVAYGEVDVNGTSHAVVGQRTLGAGRVFFVGMNLFYRDQLAGESEVSTRVAAAALQDAFVSQSLAATPVPVTFQRVGDGKQDYTYEAARDVDALVSTTWSPRWRAYVDGQPVALAPHERLMRVWLPAGRHHLTLVYRPFGTPWPVVGAAMGGAAAVLLAVLAGSGRRGTRRRADMGTMGTKRTEP
jgi:hypothetical protein